MGTSGAAQPSQRWSNHQWLGATLRAAIAVAPVVLATVAAFVLFELWPEADRTTWAAARIVGVVLISAAVAAITSSLANRLLPLAALLKLSLIFPDQAPSRFRLAIKASSSRQLAREVSEATAMGLAEDSNEAAGQILLLTTAVGEHDRRTRGHSERVRVYSRLLGEELGLTTDELEKLQWGALLHDLGKITVPQELLNKADALDDDEWLVMKQHPEAGRRLIEPVRPFLGEWAAAAEGHHERWDGAGYPWALQGEEIPLSARIVAVADAYEVMTATRSYKKPMPAAEARTELTSNAGSHFDPAVVRAFLNISVGQLRLAAGPRAFLLGLPAVGWVIAGIGRVPALAGTLMSSSGSVAVTSAATALAVTSFAPPVQEWPAQLAMVESSADLDSEAEAPRLDSTAATVGTRTPGETTIVAGTASEALGDAREPASPAVTQQQSQGEAPTTQPDSAADPSASSTTVPLPAVSTTEPPATESEAGPPATKPTEPAGPGDAQGSPPTTPPTTTPPTTPPTTGQPPDTDPSPPQYYVESGDLVVIDHNRPDLTSSGPYQDDAAFFLLDEGPSRLSDDLDHDDVFIPAGTRVCSYYLFLAPATWARISEIELSFDDQVLGVMWSADGLSGSDDLELAQALYPASESLPQLEPWLVDELSWTSGSVTVIAASPVGFTDAVRIITSC